jgi:thioredoxin reductase (NADPH)
LRRFLSRNQIIHDWVSPDSANAVAAWTDALRVQTDCPVLRLPGGTLLSNPKMRDLAGADGAAEQRAPA